MSKEKRIDLLKNLLKQTKNKQIKRFIKKILEQYYKKGKAKKLFPKSFSTRKYQIYQDS